VEDAIKQTEEQTNIRVYGGHIFASSGEIGKHAQAWSEPGNSWLGVSHTWTPKDKAGTCLLERVSGLTELSPVFSLSLGTQTSLAARSTT
jgi:hypothetical protein